MFSRIFFQRTVVFPKLQAGWGQGHGLLFHPGGGSESSTASRGCFLRMLPHLISVVSFTWAYFGDKIPCISGLLL
jgi:hypothetical protein